MDRAMVRTMLEDRIAALRNSLLKGQSVCPWAKEAARDNRITFVDADDLREIQQGLAQIATVPTGAALALVARQDLTSDDAVVQWANKRLEDLLVLAALMHGTTGGADRIRQQVRQDLDRSRQSPLRVTLVVDHRPLVVFVTSPHYTDTGPEPFPRRSPHLVLWATFVADVKEAMEAHPAAAATVRDRRTRAYGAPYDADALVLPQHPSKPRTCDSCNVCCHVLAIPSLAKPAATRCRHLQRSETGCCRIYQERPAECRSYRCMWLQGLFGRKDRPDRIGVLFTVVDLSDAQVIVAHVTKPGAEKGRAKELIENMSKLVPVYVVHPDQRRQFYVCEDVAIHADRWWAELETVSFLESPELKR